MKEIIIGVGMFAVVLIIAYGAWTIGRVINYNLSYKGMVRETIQEMVKEECLK